MSAPAQVRTATTHLLDSVATIWHRVISESPGRVIVTSNYPIEEAAILILSNDLYTIAGTRHIVQNERPAARGIEPFNWSAPQLSWLVGER